jgi:hypothetical protein
VRGAGEQQVAVLLVRVRLLRILLDADHPAPHRARLVTEGALEREVRGRARRDVLLEGVVVEVLGAVDEVGAGHAGRRTRAGEVVLDPHLSLGRPEATGNPVELRVPLDPRVMRGEVPRRAREVLDRDVLDAGSVANHDLDRRVHVRREVLFRRRVLLDQREAALGLCDDEETPEERAAFHGVRDAHVQRLLEHDPARHVHEQPLAPHGGVVRGELLVPADERVEELVVLGKRLEADALGSALDLDSALPDVGDTGDVELEQRRRRRDRLGAVRGPGVGIEAREIGEAPVLVLRGRQREPPVALEQVRARGRHGILPSEKGAKRRWRISALPSGSLKNVMSHTLV